MSSRRARSGGRLMRMTSSRYQQIETEPPGRDLLAQVAIGRRHNPHINPPRDIFAHPPQLALLDRPQHLGLRAERQLADFIENERAGMGFFEHAGTLGHGPGKGAARVPEQLGLDQIVGERRAVQRAERPAAAWAPPMERPGHELLPAAALSFDQDGEGRRRCALHRLTNLHHRAADAEQLASALGGTFGASCDRRREGGTGGGRRHREEHRRPRHIGR